jgi:hypothetical protein
MLYGSMVERNEFSVVGSTTEADVEFDGSLTLYERQGQDGSLFTYEPVGDVWLQWNPA